MLQSVDLFLEALTYRMSATDLAKLVLLSAIWGGSFIFLRIAVPETGPLLTAILRTSLAGLALFLYAKASRVDMAWRRNVKYFAIVGLFAGVIPFTCFSYAALALPAAYSAVLNATAPLFSALLSVVLMGERLTIRKLAGLLLGIAGVAVLVGAGTLTLSAQTLLAVGACLVAALCYATSTLVVQKTGRPGDIHPTAMAAGSLALGGAMMLPALPFVLPSALPSPLALASIAAMALLSSGLAQALFIPMIVKIGPTRAMSVSFLIPLFSMTWGAIFLGERIGPGTIAGALVVLLAMAMVLSSGRKV